MGNSRRLTDRATEHLGVGDEGVIELRKLLREQIERVQQGLEPLGMIRDPAKTNSSILASSMNASVCTPITRRNGRLLNSISLLSFQPSTSS